MTVILAAIVGTVLTGCILIADVFSPPPANLPILYAVPLILVALWLESRRAIWYLLPFMLIFTVIGELWGPPMSLTSLSLKSIVINRAFAVGALMLVAIILHIRLGKLSSHSNASIKAISVAHA